MTICAGWEALVAFNPTLTGSLPRFSSTVSALGLLLTDAAWWGSVAHTMAATAIGLAACVALGVSLGLLLSLRTQFFTAAKGPVDFARTVPPLAVIPLGMLVLGPTMIMEVVLIVVSAVWPVLLQTVYGVHNVDPALVETARVYEVPRWRRALFVVAPAASPYVVTGIRVAAAISLLVAVGTELIAGVPGLGHEIGLRGRGGAVASLYACILVAGTLGVLVNAGLKAGEHRLLDWHLRPRELVR
ncbi:MAG: ABC transporter permease subunit [Pseudonocardia sp.]|nr:ABC transporter permease subunit [Pseudonocardia sp.]